MRGRPGLIAIAAVIAIAGVGIAVWARGSSGTPSVQQTTVSTRPRPPAVLRIIFPEGYTRAEMARRVEAVRLIAIHRRHVTPLLTGARYLAATSQLRPPPGFRRYAHGQIEGFLFPATYVFTAKTTALQLGREQLVAFRSRFATVDLRYARSKNLTPYDVLIIASMIEKEAVVPAERPLIAAVIYNRLHLHMPLGIDATIRYGLNVPGTQSLTEAELTTPSPYNTRLVHGLPPTPIANPGLASIRAAAHPARVDYLYYVRKPDKRHHFFTASGAEFLRKACEYGYGCG
jgi:UPF0755 protein